MKNTNTYKLVFTCIITLFFYTLTAQQAENQNNNKSTFGDTNKRESNYQKLKDMGYSEKEIFEDLGNANFLLERYETAVFWYQKLKTVSINHILGNNYQKRYQYALAQTTGVNSLSDLSSNRDWLEQIIADYQVRKKPFNTHKEQSYVTKYRGSKFSTEKR